MTITLEQKKRKEERQYIGEYYTALTYRMDRKIKRLWIKALRSGEYEQGKNSLKTINAYYRDQAKYCCLGVLCEIDDRVHTTDNDYETKITFAFNGDYTLSTSASFLPDGFPEVVGIRFNTLTTITNTSNPILFRSENTVGGLEEHTLANLNDIGFTFDQIADLIDYFL